MCWCEELEVGEGRGVMVCEFVGGKDGERMGWDGFVVRGANC